MENWGVYTFRQALRREIITKPDVSLRLNVMVDELPPPLHNSHLPPDSLGSTSTNSFFNDTGRIFIQPNDTLTQGFTQGFVQPNDILTQGFVQPNDTLTQGFVQPNDILTQGFVQPNDTLTQGFVQPNDTLMQDCFMEQDFYFEKASCLTGDTVGQVNKCSSGLDDFSLDFLNDLEIFDDNSVDHEKKVEVVLEYGVQTFYSLVACHVDELVEILSYQPAGFLIPSVFLMKPQPSAGTLSLVVTSAYLIAPIVIQSPDVYDVEALESVQRLVVLLCYELRQHFGNHSVHRQCLDPGFYEISDNDRCKIKNAQLIHCAKVFAKLLFDQFLLYFISSK